MLRIFNVFIDSKSISISNQSFIFSVNCYHSPVSANPCSVSSLNSVFSVSLVFELDKGKARGVPGHPDVFELSVAIKDILKLVLAHVVAQVTHVNLRGKIVKLIHGIQRV